MLEGTDSAISISWVVLKHPIGDQYVKTETEKSLLWTQIEFTAKNKSQLGGKQTLHAPSKKAILLLGTHLLRSPVDSARLAYKLEFRS